MLPNIRQLGRENKQTNKPAFIKFKFQVAENKKNKWVYNIVLDSDTYWEKIIKSQEINKDLRVGL